MFHIYNYNLPITFFKFYIHRFIYSFPKPQQTIKMASSRLLLAVLLAASVAVVLSSKAPKDVIVGSRVYNDHLLQREFLKVPSKMLQVVKSRKTYTGDNYSKITQVRLLDQNKNGNGATAVVVNGGPGLSYVTVDFKSVRGHSIDFIIEIYGR